MKLMTLQLLPTRRATLAAVSLLPFIAAGAWAHGDGAHAESPKFDAGRVQATPFGQAGEPSKATRTIHVDMADTMRFAPDGITVRRGETVRLVIANKGQLLHELVPAAGALRGRHAGEGDGGVTTGAP